MRFPHTCLPVVDTTDSHICFVSGIFSVTLRTSSVEYLVMFTDSVKAAATMHLQLERILSSKIIICYALILYKSDSGVICQRRRHIG